MSRMHPPWRSNWEVSFARARYWVRNPGVFLVPGFRRCEVEVADRYPLLFFTFIFYKYSNVYGLKIVDLESDRCWLLLLGIIISTKQAIDRGGISG